MSGMQAWPGGHDVPDAVKPVRKTTCGALRVLAERGHMLAFGILLLCSFVVPLLKLTAGLVALLPRREFEKNIVGKAIAVWMHKEPGLNLPTFFQNRLIK